MRFSMIFAALLVLFFLPFNLTASPSIVLSDTGDPAMFEYITCESIAYADVFVDGSDLTLMSGALHTTLIRDYGTAFDIVVDRRSSNWILTDAALRQMLSPLPI